MEPKHYFKERIEQNELLLKKLKSASFLLAMLRLCVFLAAIIVIYVFSNDTAIVAVTAIVGFVGFLILVSKYTDVKNKRDYHQNLKELNLKELAALSGDYSGFENGEEFVSGEHHFNQDIDLFGTGSLFQLINRTGTISGKIKLADILNSNNVENVIEKQDALKELSKDPDWRQDYFVTTSLIKNEVATSTMVKWIKGYKTVIPGVFLYLPLVYALLSLAGVVAYGVGLIPGDWILYLFFFGLAITGSFIKKVNILYNDAGKMRGTFSQYAKLIAAIEGRNYESKLLNTIEKKLETEGKNASHILSELSKEINNLDQRNNIFFAFVANGFILWDLRYAYRIEKWMKDHEATIDYWFEVVAEFDALNSLANFAFVHNKYVYPTLVNNETVLSANNIGHPLLQVEKRVDNDITIKDGNFFIITGANMAGKSTFLRTVALNIVMANTGLPVCSETFNYRPIKLISSMRTSDSLKDDESYFFSELKRLKYIVDQIENETYFIILDEILKGTNSKDKAEGSKQFVERLVKTKSTGLIATHDLSLCVIADDSEVVENHYFDAQIIDDELFFDYRFKEGICQNMNASFLLKKMGIV
jgi:ABC-type multidrug transport system fused ATPase/permease subunit